MSLIFSTRKELTKQKLQNIIVSRKEDLESPLNDAEDGWFPSWHQFFHHLAPVRSKEALTSSTLPQTQPSGCWVPAAGLCVVAEYDVQLRMCPHLFSLDDAPACGMISLPCLQSCRQLFMLGWQLFLLIVRRLSLVHPGWPWNFCVVEDGLEFLVLLSIWVKGCRDHTHGLMLARHA